MTKCYICKKEIPGELPPEFEEIVTGIICNDCNKSLQE